MLNICLPITNMNDVTVYKDCKVYTIENSKGKLYDFNDQVYKDNVYILYTF